MRRIAHPSTAAAADLTSNVDEEKATIISTNVGQSGIRVVINNLRGE